MGGHGLAKVNRPVCVDFYVSVVLGGGARVSGSNPKAVLVFTRSWYWTRKFLNKDRVFVARFQTSLEFSFRAQFI